MNKDKIPGVVSDIVDKFSANQVEVENKKSVEYYI